jgi:hypothetical protein
LNYKASLDSVARILTVIFITLFLYFALENGLRAFKAETTGTLVVSCALVLLSILFPVGLWMFAPASYTLTDDALVINRPGGKVIIPFTDVAGVEAIPEAELAGSVRAFGNGGIFGYYGSMIAPRYGMMTWYATQRKNYVLIAKRNGKKVLITPDDLGMVSVLEKKLYG